MVIACKKDDSASHVPAPAAPAPAPASQPAAPAAQRLAARADGVGPLDAKVKISEGSLAERFPGHDIKRVSESHGGDLREEYFGVSKRGALLLRVHADDDRLTAVDIVSNDIANPFGITLGSSHAAVMKAIGPLDCEDAGKAVDWREDIVMCTSHKVATYTLDFSLFKEEGLSAKELLENPAQLAKAKLVALTWQVGP
jgi:hypothetical protein